MKILLTKDVPTLGSRGDVIEVKDGHARNFIIPQGLGVVADSRAIREADARKAKEKGKIAAHKQTETEYRARLKEVSLHFKRKANDKGHLFAAVSLEDLVEGLHRHGFKLIKKEDITTPHLKAVGEHQVGVRVGNEELGVKVQVEAL